MRNNHYQVKKTIDLSENEIKTILDHWNIENIRGLSSEHFKQLYHNSEFHLLTDSSSKLLSAARINFNFRVEIRNKKFRVAEFVGFVSIEKRKGYGKELLFELIQNLKERNIETIGFCEKDLRSFYEKCNIPIFYGQSKHLREKEINQWSVSSDDDILNLTLSKRTTRLFENLNAKNVGYIIF